MILHKTYRSALVAIPHESVWGPIQRIREQHDSKIRRWMPHITLIYPFCPAAEFESVATRELSPVCRDIQPIEVTLTRLRTFSHGKGRFTVWLEPEPTRPLLDLHADLWTAVSYDHDFEPRIGRFVPHLSVGQVRGKQNADRLVAELQAAWRPLTFLLSEVQLIALGGRPKGVFQLARAVPLGDAG